MSNQIQEQAPRSSRLIDIGLSVLPQYIIAREGWGRSGLTLTAGLVSGWLGEAGSKNWLPRRLATLSKPLIGLGLLTAFVYRDPDRIPLGNASNYIYAPADGKIVSVQLVGHEPLFVNGPAYRIEIKSHLLDVPIQRTPMPGRVQYLFSPPNQSAQIGLQTPTGQKLLLSYQADPHALGRLPFPLADVRFLFWRIQAGESLAIVQKIGLRGFGQPLLTTLYLPTSGVDILCRGGQHTQAGMTVLGRLTPGEH